MYTVKRFTTGQEIFRIKLSDEKSLVYQCATVKPIFVIMKDEKPVFVINHLTGKKDLEQYDRKVTAQQVADWYNSQA